jgi:hypothetical protein
MGQCNVSCCDSMPLLYLGSSMHLRLEARAPCRTARLAINVIGGVNSINPRLPAGDICFD